MKIFKFTRDDGRVPVATLIYFPDPTGRWHWELRARNDHTICRSAGDGYDNWTNARTAVDSLLRMTLPTCDIEQVHEPLRRVPDVPGPDIGLVELALRGTLNMNVSLSVEQGRFTICRHNVVRGVQSQVHGNTLTSVLNAFRSKS